MPLTSDLAILRARALLRGPKDLGLDSFLGEYSDFLRALCESSAHSAAKSFSQSPSSEPVILSEVSIARSALLTSRRTPCPSAPGSDSSRSVLQRTADDKNLYFDFLCATSAHSAVKSFLPVSPNPIVILSEVSIARSALLTSRRTSCSPASNCGPARNSLHGRADDKDLCFDVPRALCTTFAYPAVKSFSPRTLCPAQN